MAVEEIDTSWVTTEPAYRLTWFDWALVAAIASGTVTYLAVAGWAIVEVARNG